MLNLLRILAFLINYFHCCDSKPYKTGSKHQLTITPKTYYQKQKDKQTRKPTLVSHQVV